MMNCIPKITTANVEDYLVNSPARTSFKDNLHRHVTCNSIAAQQLGLEKPSDIHMLYDVDLCCSKFANQFIRNDKYVMQENILTTIEKTILHTGDEISLYTVKTPVYNLRDKIIGIFALAIPMNHQQYRHHDVDLTTREKECLNYIMKGFTYKQIGNEIHLSPRTIEQYADTIKMKFGCNSKYELINLLSLN